MNPEELCTKLLYKNSCRFCTTFHLHWAYSYKQSYETAAQIQTIGPPTAELSTPILLRLSHSLPPGSLSAEDVGS